MTTQYTIKRIPDGYFRPSARAGTATGGFTEVGTLVRERMELSGWKNESWKKLVSLHQNAATDFVAYHEYQGPQVPVFCWAPKKSETGANAHMRSIITFSGVIPCNIDYSQVNWSKAQILSSVAYDRAFIKLMQKARGDFRALTTAGEMKETLRSLRSPYKLLADRLNGLHKQQYRTFKKLRSRGDAKAKTTWQHIAATTWLETAFGLSPLMNDISSAADAFIECFDPFFKVITATGRNAQSTALTADSGTDFWRFETRGDKILDAGWSITSCFRTQPQERPTIYNSGISAADLVPTAWELVPFSFLFDYFIPIGSYLDATASWVGAPIQWSTATERLRVKGVGTKTVRTDPHPVSGQYKQPLGRTTTTLFVESKRITRQGSVVIAPVFHPSVDFIEKFNMSRGLNIAALIKVLTSYQ